MGATATGMRLYGRPVATVDEAQAHLSARTCCEDHPSVRMGDGWLVLTCEQCHDGPLDGVVRLED